MRQVTNFESQMGKFRIAEHCDLVGFFTWMAAQEGRRTEWVTRITAVNYLQAHNVTVKLG
jgi:hypothetical protein